mmetsp:Transcript_6067/g.19321  ORF Transcript_6067/g.19321 Transcript_6067/m.19321 type:complete len:330 (-) Transcript_6067:33-1022(-)
MALRRERAAKVFDEVDEARRGALDGSQLRAVAERLGLRASSDDVDGLVSSSAGEEEGLVPKTAAVEWLIDLDRKQDAVMGGAGAGSTGRSPRGSVTGRASRELGSQSGLQADSVVLAARNERKRAEADMQLLANRLAHLRAEEERAQKRIGETRKRARELASVKAERLKRERAKQAERERQRKQEEEAARRLREQRERAAQRRLQARTLAHKSKRQQWEEQQRVRAQREEEVKRQQEQQEEEKRRRREEVRRSMETAKMRREREEQDQRRRLWEQYQRRMESERKRLAEAEALIVGMEEEEQQLIERLKRAQEKQRVAYADLEMALRED